jgi:serine/threonine-protein kinase CLA4
MNPGPAPRPPTNQQPLSLTPSPNIPGNMSSSTIGSGSLKTSSTFPVGSSTTSLTLNRTQTGDSSGSGGVSIVKHGMAQVKEDGFAKLLTKKRWLVLREFRLDIHKAENSPVISTSIKLSDVTHVGRSETVAMAFEVTRVAVSGTNNANSGMATNNIPTKTISCIVKASDDLYDWVDAIYTRCPGMGGVSNPTNFSHQVHVGFDPQTGGFTGLPQEWSKLLSTSAITKEDYAKNPQAVIEVLEFYSDITKRANDPNAYPSLTPTPPVDVGQNKQLGAGLNMNQVNQKGPAYAPEKPSGLQRMESYNTEDSQNGYNSQQRTPPGGNDPRQDDREMQRRMEQMRLEKEREEARKDQEAYNASIPKTRSPAAKQEVGMFGGGGGDSYGNSANGPRYNPSRAAPSAPGTRQPAPGSLRQLNAQRPAPSAPNAQAGASPGLPRNGPSPKNGQSGREPSPGSNLRPQEQGSQQRTPSPRAPNGGPQGQQAQVRSPAQPSAAQGSRLPAPTNTVKPLNIVAKQPTGAPAAAGVKQAEAALTRKDPNAGKDSRMSTMSEAQVMQKLSQVVTSGDPNICYQKSKKVGQGASGSVYLAKVLNTANTPAAKAVIRQAGGAKDAKVAIKQMDLAHQPRKELIVNEILVMKESSHLNIVNYIDSYLRGPNELWVIMEYMEGGALTDVIDNNTIEEDQIATICNETCKGLEHLHRQNIIHRDIKSDNVLLDAMGHVKISKSSALY